MGLLNEFTSGEETGPAIGDPIVFEFVRCRGDSEALPLKPTNNAQVNPTIAAALIEQSLQYTYLHFPT